jgi:putative SOS response-associated peptidase YedK
MFPFMAPIFDSIYQIVAVDQLCHQQRVVLWSDNFSAVVAAFRSLISEQPSQSFFLRAGSRTMQISDFAEVENEMCGRYAIHAAPAELAALFKVSANVPNFAATYNAAPTQKLPVIRSNRQTGQRHMDLLSWGLVPKWAKSIQDAAKLINARSETASAKPSFRDAWVRRRCIVPANAFYEWRRVGRVRQPHAIAMRDGSVIAMAGLWEGWKNPVTGEWHKSFAVLTTTANDLVASVHDRMPVILAPDAWPDWLAETDIEYDRLDAALVAAMHPYPAEMMQIWPVAADVGDVGQNGPQLLKPIDDSHLFIDDSHMFEA